MVARPISQILQLTRATSERRQPFCGFEHPSANYIYCPNQFFEVCLRHESRCVVRIVAFVLRETLGFLDKNGNPVKQDIRISYVDIEKHAGVSCRSIRKALDRAIDARYIECVTPGTKKCRGQSGRVGEYRLKWANHSASYINAPAEFDGFYIGEGHRSPIPKAFFFVVIPRETLAMAKVVGVVLRHTVGYANQFGTGRREHAPLSYSYIHEFTHLRDPKTLADTLRDAESKNYITKVSDGCFDRNGGSHSEAATYAIKWLEHHRNSGKTAKTQAGTLEDGKNPSGMTAESLAGKDGRNPSERKTAFKDTDKQQLAAAYSDVLAALRGQGIGEDTAIDLCRRSSVAEIEQQSQWLPFRNAKHPAGCLIRAIEERWEKPTGAEWQMKADEEHERQRTEQAEKQALEIETKRAQAARRESLRQSWGEAPPQHHVQWVKIAMDQAPNDIVRYRIRERSMDLRNPPDEALEAMAANLHTPIGESS